MSDQSWRAQAPAPAHPTITCLMTDILGFSWPAEWNLNIRRYAHF